MSLEHRAPPSLPTSSTTIGAMIRKQLGESFLAFLENASLCSMNENIGPWQAPSGSGMGVKGRGDVSPWNRRERRVARLFPFLFLSVPAKSWSMLHCVWAPPWALGNSRHAVGSAWQMGDDPPGSGVWAGGRGRQNWGSAGSPSQVVFFLGVLFLAQSLWAV